MRLLARAVAEEWRYWKHRWQVFMGHPEHRTCRGYWDH